jgi:hypothetical protein
MVGTEENRADTTLDRPRSFRDDLRKRGAEAVLVLTWNREMVVYYAFSAHELAARAGSTGGRRASRDGCLVPLRGPDPYDALDLCHPYLAVTDSSGPGGCDDDPGDVRDVGVVEQDPDPDLQHQRYVVLRPR